MHDLDLRSLEPRRDFFARRAPRTSEWVLCPHCMFETLQQRVGEPACCLSCRLDMKAGVPTKREQRELKDGGRA